MSTMFDYMHDYKSVLDMTVEALIDQLHSLASEGRLSEAIEVADQIKELQKSGV